MSVDAPALRDMRRLPVVDEEEDATTSGWGFREGLVAACLLVCVASVAVGGYLWATAPKPPQPVDRDGLIAARIESLKPREALALWRDLHAPLLARGELVVEVDGRAVGRAEAKAVNQILIVASAVLASVSVVVAVGVGLFGGRRA